VYRLLTDPVGNLLDVTQLGRFPTSRLGFAVEARDQTCLIPSCHRPAVPCDLDHTEPHPRGPTAYANLGPLRRRHHRWKTSRLIQLRQLQPGVFELTMPTGHTTSSKPNPNPSASGRRSHQTTRTTHHPTRRGPHTADHLAPANVQGCWMAR
jgi:hypothetical protein